MKDFPLNSIVSSGYVVERLNLLKKIRIKQYLWKAFLNKKDFKFYLR
jgi:hypothetical protein